MKYSALLKYEGVNLCEYVIVDEVRMKMSRFIKKVDNLKQLHSAHGLKSPVKYEEIFRGENSEEHAGIS